jgi:Trp operon repressor
VRNNSLKIDWIVKLLTSTKNKKELKLFLIDILSPAEIDDIYNRLQIIQELTVHESPHRDVSKKFNVSISKVTRAASVTKYGSGVFKKMFGSKAK